MIGVPRIEHGTYQSPPDAHSLFPIDSENDELPDIPGLSYLRYYISEAEERAFLDLIDAEPWDASWERRRQLYGASYGKEETVSALPPWGNDLARRMLSEQITDRPFNQMLINEYLPGQGIALHRDYLPFDRTVVSLSLLVLTDKARYEWQHGIARRKNDRWRGMLLPRVRRLSVTFRVRITTEPSAPLMAGT